MPKRIRKQHEAKKRGDVFYDGHILAWRVHEFASSPEGRAKMKETARMARERAERIFKRAQVTPEQMRMVITI